MGCIEQTENAIRAIAVPEDRDQVRAFVAEARANGKSASSLKNYASRLSLMSRHFGKPLATLAKAEVTEYLGGIASVASRNAAGVTLKSYLRWANDGTVPASIAWWRPKTIRPDMPPEAVLTTDEISRMIAATDSLRDRALLHVLFDSGCRVGELLSLRRMNCGFDGIGATIVVDGKTGRRRIRLVSSAPILRDLLNGQSDRRPDAPVFQGRDGAPLSYHQARRIVENAATRADIQKPVNCHLLRHSRATELCKRGVPEPALRSHFGWTPGSGMTARYVHMGGQDVDRAVLRASGLDIPETQFEPGIETIACPVCGTKNDPSYSYCSKCSASLTQDVNTLADDLLDRFVEKFVNATWQPPSDMMNAPVEDLEKLRVARTEEVRRLARHREEIIQKSVLRSIERGRQQENGNA